MSELSIEMKGYAFQAAVQAAADAASKSSMAPEECAVTVAKAANSAAHLLGLTDKISHPAPPSPCGCGQ